MEAISDYRVIGISLGPLSCDRRLRAISMAKVSKGLQELIEDKMSFMWLIHQRA